MQIYTTGFVPSPLRPVGRIEQYYKAPESTTNHTFCEIKTIPDETLHIRAESHVQQQIFFCFSFFFHVWTLVMVFHPSVYFGDETIASAAGSTFGCRDERLR